MAKKSTKIEPWDVPPAAPAPQQVGGLGAADGEGATLSVPPSPSVPAVVRFEILLKDAPTLLVERLPDGRWQAWAPNHPEHSERPVFVSVCEVPEEAAWDVYRQYTGTIRSRFTPTVRPLTGA